MSFTDGVQSSDRLDLLVEKLPNDELAKFNCAFVAPDSLPLGFRHGRVWKIRSANGTAFLPISGNSSVSSGKIAFSGPLRQFLFIALNDKVTLELVDTSKICKISHLALDVKRLGGSGKITIERKDVMSALKTSCVGTILNVKQPVVVMIDRNILTLAPSALNPDAGAPSAGLLEETDAIEIALAVDPKSREALQLSGLGNGASKSLNFDFNGMGVGGLDSQFKDIITRAFFSRNLSQDIVDMYGIEHAKGILLFGPPGTGKTLIARTIAEMFGHVKVKVVNGPEILNRYVGQSEENLRGVFAEAFKEWGESGAKSDLHVIIFDEIDALFKARGSTKSGTGTEDSMVNQLLTILDGVDSPKNILVIGMTNRKDLLDEALLRKGRLGIHIKIDLPDEAGRREILDIHTRKLRKNGLIAPDVDLSDWALRTANFSGADIKGLIDEASYIANSRNFDIREGAKPVLRELKGHPEPVTKNDLEIAFTKVSPSFGVAVDKLAPYVKRKFVPFNESIRFIIQSIQTDFSALKRIEGAPTRSVLLTGPKSSGKTALAVHLAVMSEAPLISLLTSGDLAGSSDSDRIHRLDTELQKTLQSKYSVLVLDNLEGILGATRDGRTYSAQMVLKLESILNDPSYRNLLIIGTSSYKEFLDSVGLSSSFKEYSVKNVETYEEAISILNGIGLQTNGSNGYVVPERLFPSLSIREFLEKIQTFKALELYPSRPWDTDAFFESLSRS